MAGKHFIRLILLGLLMTTLLLSACRPSSAVPTPDPEALITEAAATVGAQLTQSAALTPSPEPTQTPAPTDTAVLPTATVEQVDLPPAATNTSVPPTAPPAGQDDAAGFVDDVTIPDGTVIAPGAAFEKVWRIRNSGKTTWTTAYALVLIDGERMGSPDSVPVPKEVKPGETVDIAVNLTAPATTGTYQTFFRLRNASGQYFRLDGSGDLWVKIVVGTALTSTPDSETATPEPSATTETSE